MAKKGEKSWQDYHEEIEALKEERARRWQEQVGSTDGLPLREQRMATIRGENSPAVMEVTGQIAILREEQLALHAEPPVDPGLSEHESDQSHVAHGHAPRFGTIRRDEEGEWVTDGGNA